MDVRLPTETVVKNIGLMTMRIWQLEMDLQALQQERDRQQQVIGELTAAARASETVVPEED
jgi:hypothetical protein